MRESVLAAVLLVVLMAFMVTALYIGNSPPEARTSQEQSMEAA